MNSFDDFGVAIFARGLLARAFWTKRRTLHWRGLRPPVVALGSVRRPCIWPLTLLAACLGMSVFRVAKRTSKKRYAKPDNTNAKLLSTPRTGLGLSLSTDSPSKDGAENPNNVIFYFNNKTNREIIPVLFSTSSPGADLKKATKITPFIKNMLPKKT